MRTSPEAPAPVIIPEKEYSIPGGAGNVAMNLSSMGAKTTCIGVVGNDFWGKKLIEILNMNDINRKEILTDDLLFTKCGWIYQYNAIPENTDYQKTIYFMEKTYKHFYGDLDG